MKLKISGFTLVEMSIVLIIISLLAGAVLTLIPMQLTSQLTSKNLATLDTIQSAINMYVKQNNALPCPAPGGSALNSSGFGVSSDCTAVAPTGISDVQIGTTSFYVRYGVVPTRTLNLPDNYMFDAWNRRISYAVVRQMAVPSTQTINFNNFAQNFPGTEPNTIKIIDAASPTANSINQANSSSVPNYVAYTLVARGPAGNGAYRYDGSTQITCPSTGNDKENCTNDNIFMDSYYNTNASTYYDNNIRWKTYAQLKSDSGFPFVNSFSSSSSGSSFGVKAALFTYTLSNGNNLGTPTTQNSWFRRPLNTVNFNNIPNASISRSILAPVYFLTISPTGMTDSDIFTLGAGKYIIRALAASVQLGQNKIRIFNVSSNATVLSTTSTVMGQSTTGHYPEASAYLNLTSATSFGIDHIYTGSSPTFGWGRGYSPDGSPYDFLQVHIWQVG